LRRSEAAHLRSHPCNVDTGMLALQFGKGGTSRSVPLPKQSHGASMRPCETVRALQQEDLKKGDDGVLLPASFEQQATSAAPDLVWPWCCPAHRLTRGAARRAGRRDHGHETAIQRAIKAGIPKRVSPHTRRHTCATHLLQANDAIRQMQQRLGHSDVRTTRIDTHTLTSDLKP
jgi:site-specific recombinase XerD